MSERSFICAECGKTFQSDWDKAEAIAEYERDFGHLGPTAVTVVCDDCYQRFQRWLAERVLQ